MSVKYAFNSNVPLLQDCTVVECWCWLGYLGSQRARVVLRLLRLHPRAGRLSIHA